MCYDVKAQLQTQLKRAKRYTPELVPEIQEIIQPHEEGQIPIKNRAKDWFHVSGFAHPHLFIYTGSDEHESGYIPQLAQWGLIPHWSKDVQGAEKFWNNTLNARSETIFEKPSFRDAAKTKRCLIDIDGFFEHHHYKGNRYPFYFHRENNEPLTLAGLWSEWTDKTAGETRKTFAIVTQRGNALFEEIHNNPKLKEPRMPVILTPDEENLWLDTALKYQELQPLFSPRQSYDLNYYTVQKIKGKAYLGNCPEVIEPHIYPELKSHKSSPYNDTNQQPSQGNLFGN
jgi:putative SOS response-associated peptidase YedK